MSVEKTQQELYLDIPTCEAGKFELTNFDYLNTTITAIRDKYANLVVKEEDIDEMTKVRATLNKVEEDFANRRKKLEKEYMKPFKVGKDQIVSLEKMLSEASHNINHQLREFEEIEKGKKLVELVKEINPLIANETQYFGIDPRRLVKDGWLNKSFKFDKAINELKNDVLPQIQGAYELLKFIPNAKYVDEVVYEFKRQFDINKESPTSLITRLMNENAIKHEELDKEVARKKELASQGNKFSIRYIITGTKEQLKGVSNYLKENNISFDVEKVGD